MTYYSYVAIAAAVYLAIAANQFRRNSVPLRSSVLTAAMTAVSGFVFAKLLYILLLAASSWRLHGASAFVRFQPSEMSIVGCCLGALLAVYASGRRQKTNTGRLMDVYSPVFAIGIFLLRAGEYFSLSGAEMLGAGEYIGDYSFSVFPLAVFNRWDEAYFAVCLLEAAAALYLAIRAFIMLRKDQNSRGQIVSYVCFCAALAQILCESLRSQCMRWGFVKIEQVLCAVVVMYIIVADCRNKALPFRILLRVILLSLSCILVMVLLEFAMDKTDIPKLICYLLMILMLSGLYFIRRYVLKHDFAATCGKTV